MAALTAAAIALAGASVIQSLRNKPAAPPPMPTIPAPPKPVSLQTEEARTANLRRARARITGASGRKSTLLTGPSGITNAPAVAQKTLLGQ